MSVSSERAVGDCRMVLFFFDVWVLCCLWFDSTEAHLSLSVTRAGLCGRCGLRVIATGSQEEEICPLSLGFFFSRSLAGVRAGLLSLSCFFFLALSSARWLARSLSRYFFLALSGARAGLLARVLSCALSRFCAGLLAQVLSCALSRWLAGWLARSGFFLARSLAVALAGLLARLSR